MLSQQNLMVLHSILLVHSSACDSELKIVFVIIVIIIVMISQQNLWLRYCAAFYLYILVHVILNSK